MDSDLVDCSGAESVHVGANVHLDAVMVSPHHSCWRASLLAFLSWRAARHIYYVYSSYIMYILCVYIQLYTWLGGRLQCQKPARQQLCSTSQLNNLMDVRSSSSSESSFVYFCDFPFCANFLVMTLELQNAYFVQPTVVLVIIGRVG